MFSFNYNYKIEQALNTIDKIYQLCDNNKKIGFVLLAVNILFNDMTEPYFLKYVKPSNEYINYWPIYISVNLKYLNKYKVFITSPAGEELETNGNCCLAFNTK